MTPNDPPSTSRAVFDTLKGIGIVEVILHHSLGHGARKFADPLAFEWWLFRGLNRVLHFAIPLFLLISAALLTQSLVKRPDWDRFVRRRVARTLWPYILWSVVYWAFRIQFLKVGSDVYVAERTYPLLGTLTGPNLLVDIPELVRELAWGKAYFHLYFMVVLLQLALLLPFLIFSLRGRDVSLPKVLLAAAAIQLAVFLLQAHVLRVAFPASSVLWYVPSILAGVWIGLDWPRWAREWDRARLWIAPVAVAGLALYLPMALWLDSGRWVNSIGFNVTFAAFTVGTALFLLGHAPTISRSRFGPWFARFGQVSLPMFLIHPALLHFLSGPRITDLLNRLPLPPLWTAAAVLSLSYGFAAVAIRLGLDRLMFGQKFTTSRLAQSPPV